MDIPHHGRGSCSFFVSSLLLFLLFEYYLMPDRLMSWTLNFDNPLEGFIIGKRKHCTI